MKKKKSKADFLRDWGITEPYILRMGFKGLRYRNPPEKGVYWYFFSLAVRKRDVAKWGMCISCERAITVETSQGGHFMPAADCGRDLLFDPLNVNAECEHCNAFDETHLLGYAEELDRRYGSGTARSLRERRKNYKASKTPLKDWNKIIYAEKIEVLKALGLPKVDNSFASE